jgi:hypothetical protein
MFFGILLLVSKILGVSVQEREGEGHHQNKRREIVGL